MSAKSMTLKMLEKLNGGPVYFKDLLFALRETEEMSQVDLALKCGTTKAKIFDFEKGRRVPSLNLAAKLATALGHSESFFVEKILEDQVRSGDLDLKVSVKAIKS